MGSEADSINPESVGLSSEVLNRNLLPTGCLRLDFQQFPDGEMVLMPRLPGKDKAGECKWRHCQVLIEFFAQAKDFGGWPPAAELPVTHLTQEHLTLLAQKCSRQKSLDMPSFSTASPGHETRDSSSHLVAVTPMPGQQDGEEGDFLDDNAGPIPLQKLKKPAQPSKQALELHRKWQEAAEAMGGKDARIIVSAPAAKQVIFELLEGFYGPMNITDIHKVRGTAPIIA